MSDTQTQPNSILTISQLAELTPENLKISPQEDDNIFDDINNNSVMEISFSPGIQGTKYISRKIKTSTLAKGINDVLIRTANLVQDNKIINVNKVTNEVNNIINSDQVFNNKKVIRDLYKTCQIDSDNQIEINEGDRYITNSETNACIQTALNNFANTQYVSESSLSSSYISQTGLEVINGEHIINKAVIDLDTRHSGDLTANKTGQLIIIGSTRAAYGLIDSQYLYISLEIKINKKDKQSPDYAIVSVQPYITPMNGSSIQYFSFNISIAKGTQFRVRANYELDSESSGVITNNQNLLFKTNMDATVINGFRWYIA